MNRLNDLTIPIMVRLFRKNLMKKWIWQQKNYPNFTYDFKKLEDLIQKISLEQGYLIALTQTMNKDNIIQRQADALFNEAINTALIEGEVLNSDSVKACITHLWFVIIHPFDDGNGRITRAITDLVLSKIENSTISRLYSMSSAINVNRKAYYKALEHTTGYIKREGDFLDITFWCKWFLQTLYEALLETKTKLNFIVTKTKFWDKNLNLNARQIKVLNFILDIGIENFKGNLSKKKYMSISSSSSTTASRDISELLEIGCIKQVEGTLGRNISYEIVI